MENGSPLARKDQGLDLEGFREYLSKERRKKTIGQLVNYASKYGYVLQTGDASDLLKLSPKNRQHSMRALACLSKYYGCYDLWRGIKQQYDLKWTVTDDLQVFRLMYEGEDNFPVMMEWLKNVCSKIPKSYANILIYDALTGLRPDEACMSISLIHRDLDNYLKKERMVLEHFRYPELFIRKTKKAYVAIVDDVILDLGRNAGDYGYNALRLLIKRRGLDMNMSYCRKIFSTYLRMSGIESELIDLLQGRIPQSVFARHYFRPDFQKEMERVRKSLIKLHDDISA